MKPLKKQDDKTALDEDKVLKGVVDNPDYNGVFYQHTVLCQTNLPYRDPGDDVRVWTRKNGRVDMLLQAGYAWHPNKRDFMPYGLPFGPKARINLMLLNQRALKTGSRTIETGGSLYQFVTRVLKMDGKGHNMRIIQDQLIRLSTTFVLLGFADGSGQGVSLKSPIVDSFRALPFQKTDNSILWPASVTLSEEYYSSVENHAVPIDEAHMRALMGSAMDLDVYTWLAQRLCRIKAGQPVHVPWRALHDQFGQTYRERKRFKQVFLVTLKQVLAVYTAARVEESSGGLILRESPPPVSKDRVYIVGK